MENMEELSREYIVYSRQLSTSGFHGKAFDLLVMAFDKCPHLRAEHEQEFRTVLNKFNEILAAAKKMEHLFSNFGRALKFFPENAYLTNDIGKYLYKFAFYTEAWNHFQKALNLKPDFVNAEKNLNSLKNLLVERWHFRMLNDKVRNESYRYAIRDTCIPFKDSVVDLGCGTGLLAMYAYECKPVAVTACDSSEVMVDLAECITEDYCMQQMVIVNKVSTTMNYKEIGGKRSLLVTEMFDAGLFGEHVLQALDHAWACFINSVGRVIPNKGEFFIMGVNSEHLGRKYHLCSSIKTIINVSDINVHIITEDETYDCEDIALYKDLKYVTDAQSLVKIDFNSVEDIQDKLNSEEPFEVELKAKENGVINAVIGWFNLYLTDYITITTDPRSTRKANAWQQAVFFDKIPKCIAEDQTIPYQFVLNGEKLTMLNDHNSDIMRISPETLRFLNDTEYMNKITSYTSLACVYMEQMTEISQISIADFCPFPMFGMQMLKKGVGYLVCHAKTESDKLFFEKVFNANNIPLTSTKILVGDDWTKDSLHNEKFHAIFCNIFELCGDIDTAHKELTEYLKQANLHHGGLFLPSKITVKVQLVNSDWLEINNRLHDENVSNFKMSRYVNKYQVTQNFCIDFSLLEHTPVSDPIDLGTCSEEEGTMVVNVPITCNGNTNAILCWYEIEIMENLDEISTKRPNSMIDGIVFITEKVPIISGVTVNLKRCTDADGSFKILLDLTT